jgi:hypothetical protein
VADIDANLTPRITNIGSVAHQPADLGEFTLRIGRGDPVERRERGNLDWRSYIRSGPPLATADRAAYSPLVNYAAGPPPGAAL